MDGIGMDGIGSPGGRGYRAPYGANNDNTCAGSWLKVFLYIIIKI